MNNLNEIFPKTATPTADKFFDEDGKLTVRFEFVKRKKNSSFGDKYDVYVHSLVKPGKKRKKLCLVSRKGTLKWKIAGAFEGKSIMKVNINVNTEVDEKLIELLKAYQESALRFFMKVASEGELKSKAMNKNYERLRPQYENDPRFSELRGAVKRKAVEDELFDKMNESIISPFHRSLITEDVEEPYLKGLRVALVQDVEINGKTKTFSTRNPVNPSIMFPEKPGGFGTGIFDHKIQRAHQLAIHKHNKRQKLGRPNDDRLASLAEDVDVTRQDEINYRKHTFDHANINTIVPVDSKIPKCIMEFPTIYSSSSMCCVQVDCKQLFFVKSKANVGSYGLDPIDSENENEDEGEDSEPECEGEMEPEVDY